MIGRWITGTVLAVLILPPMLIAAAVWDANRHWRRSVFDWPETNAGETVAPDSSNGKRPYDSNEEWEDGWDVY